MEEFKNLLGQLLLSAICFAIIYTPFYIKHLIKKSSDLKDVKEIYKIGHDFLTKIVKTEYISESKIKTTYELDNLFAAVILWLWVWNLKNQHKDYKHFIETFKSSYEYSASIYASLSFDVEMDSMKRSLIDLKYLYVEGDGENLVNNLSYITTWASKQILENQNNVSKLANQIGEFFVDLIEANDMFKSQKSIIRK